MYQFLQNPKFKDITLVQEILFGFLCPDHEFKSKLTQFVYTQLSQVFDFSEEYSKLHLFLSRAAWKHPIALISACHVNMVNTISSIAQHYGVGLEVIRSDLEADRLIAEADNDIDFRANQLVKQNLLDETAVTMERTS